MKFPRLKPGAVLVILGMTFLTFSMASEGLSSLTKFPIAVMCLVIIILGILIEKSDFHFLSADPIEKQTDWED